MNFLNARYGEAAVDAARADLPETGRTLLSKPLLDARWYSLTTLDTLGADLCVFARNSFPRVLVPRTLTAEGRKVPEVRGRSLSDK